MVDPARFTLAADTVEGINSKLATLLWEQFGGAISVAFQREINPDHLIFAESAKEILAALGVES